MAGCVTFLVDDKSLNIVYLPVSESADLVYRSLRLEGQATTHPHNYKRLLPEM